MAYAALLYLAQELERMLHHHDSFYLSVKEEMESFYSNVISLQKVIQEFQENYSRSMIKQLESRITDVAYKARDIIDWGCYDDDRYQEKFKGCIDEVHSILEDATEIRKILEMKRRILVGSHSQTPSSSTSAVSGKDTKLGLDKDLIQIKEQLVDYRSALQIIPIVGMGGIGKTTLARSVYEDPVTVNHFDVLFWITVSQEYNTEKILKEILQVTEDAETVSQEYYKEKILKEVHQATEDVIPLTNPERNKKIARDIALLIVAVHKKLYGRRFLIVMDDVWTVEAWDSVRKAFPNTNNGSRIIVTTRQGNVAMELSSGNLHEMQLMNEVKSWALFEKEVFGQESCPPHLKRIGKIISRNCKGLPLAIVVTARILKLDPTQNWEEFERSMHETTMTSHDSQILKILSLSYDNLPPHLKTCFLYTSLFPEYYEIPSKKLVWLWVAEGFLEPAKEKRMEDVAEKCMVDLVERNLLSVAKKGFNGRIKSYTVHDILREISIKRAWEEKFSEQITVQKTNKFLQYCLPCFRNEISSEQSVCLRRIGEPSIFPGEDNTNYRYVYSFICVSKDSYYHLLPTFRFNLLRVLDVLEMPLTPLMMTGLVNLRYLSFTYTSDLKLHTLSTFMNLETLIVKNVMLGMVLYFPVLQLPKLRHFVMISPFEGSIYNLIGTRHPGSRGDIISSLQTLSGVTNFKFTSIATEILSNVVKLKIEYHNTVGWERYCLENLVRLHKLEDLTLVFYDSFIKNGVPLSQTNISFPDELRKITLTGSRISWENMSAIGSLPNLETLKLVKCWFESGEWEPIEEEFQLLKYLKLEVQNLEHWKVESSHFPCLQHLILSKCYQLEELPAEVGEICPLHKLVVQDCKPHIGNSAREILKQQQEYGNDQLQVLVS